MHFNIALVVVARWSVGGGGGRVCVAGRGANFGFIATDGRGKQWCM